MVNMLSALNAYNNQLKLGSGGGAMESTENPTGGPSFSQLLESQLDDVVNTQKSAEGAKMEALTGKGDITDLVTAIANAEMALNTIVTIRDRAISAYQDIIRMPI
ncbi:MAG: flagellar hook-basal body complex protein FliE [Alphaproteobacteria bacterium]|nr:flagellar hook-basal body complex protein FliE [Alphaproteobacteria bacterium]